MLRSIAVCSSAHPSSIQNYGTIHPSSIQTVTTVDIPSGTRIIHPHEETTDRRSGTASLTIVASCTLHRGNICQQRRASSVHWQLSHPAHCTGETAANNRKAACIVLYAVSNPTRLIVATDFTHEGWPIVRRNFEGQTDSIPLTTLWDAKRIKAAQVGEYSWCDLMVHPRVLENDMES